MRTLHLLLLLPCAACSGVGDYLAARGLDFMDCVKTNLGVGVGLAVDVHATDYMSPGVGFFSYTANTGWDDRRVHGTWSESDVINTPRVAYETLAEHYEMVGAEQQVDETMMISRLALSTLFLPNERWIRADGELTVDYYSLFNFGGVSTHRSTVLTGMLRRGGELPRLPEKDLWQRSFFEAGATAGVVHARVGVNPLQMFDFVAGWFGWDPAGDDGGGGVELRDWR